MTDVFSLVLPLTQACLREIKNNIQDSSPSSLLIGWLFRSQLCPVLIGCPHLPFPKPHNFSTCKHICGCLKMDEVNKCAEKYVCLQAGEP